MEILNIVGILGMSLILIFFFLNNIGKLNQDSFIYDLGNFIGAFLLSVYAYYINSLPFLILNLTWSFVALYDIIKGIRNLRKK